MVDCSHGNSEKQHERQTVVARDVADQLGDAKTAHGILGVMVESNLVAGKQSIPPEGPHGLVYGQSVTDACLGWKETVELLDGLRAGVQARRKLRGGGASGHVNGFNELPAGARTPPEYNSLDGLRANGGASPK
jgi:3-deoxy-7-phosphoheptulonate synthase